MAHEGSWRKFRIIRATLLLLIVAWIPYGLMISWVWRHQYWSEKIGLAVILGYVLMLIGVGCAYALWRCPRCGKVFRGLRPYAGKSCYYCNLPKGT